MFLLGMDQFVSQPVEKFRVRRLFACKSKIVGRPNECQAKMMLPKPIDDDTRGDRIVGMDHPFRKLKPSE